MPEPTRPLQDLARAVAAAAPAAPDGSRPAITGVAADSRAVRPGNLYVALPGTRTDGHDFIADAVARGAAAVVAEREVPDPGVPLLRVEDARLALAQLAAEWHGHPAAGMSLVGVTGSFGKTSVVMMLDAILGADGRRAGAIGSEMVGIRVGGEVLEETPFTTPDAMLLQRGLAALRDAGAHPVVVEVTSHALEQKRVHGLELDLGVFTNLAPLEHKEYHDSFAHYLQAKLRFFDHLRPGAPLVYFAGDPSLRQLVPDHPVTPVSCGTEPGSAVRFEALRTTAEGTTVGFAIADPIPRLGGEALPPCEFRVELPLLGKPHLRNAALAATAALVLGAGVGSVQEALQAVKPHRRRMQVIECGGFTVLDDASQHPDSLSAAFEVARQLPHRRLHLVYAIRGQRGAEVNAQLATTLGIWASKVDVASLAITSSLEAVDEGNRVDPAEREAFFGGLRDAGVPFAEHQRLDGAVRSALDRAGEGDLVLLLGALGMLEGARVLEAWCAERGIDCDL